MPSTCCGEKDALFDELRSGLHIFRLMEKTQDHSFSACESASECCVLFNSSVETPERRFCSSPRPLCFHLKIKAVNPVALRPSRLICMYLAPFESVLVTISVPRLPLTSVWVPVADPPRFMLGLFAPTVQKLHCICILGRTAPYRLFLEMMGACEPRPTGIPTVPVCARPLPLVLSFDGLCVPAPRLPPAQPGGRAATFAPLFLLRQDRPPTHPSVP